MRALLMLAAAGVWPAVPLSGYVLCARPLRLFHGARPRARLPLPAAVAVMTVAGLAVWSVPLLATAVLGVYRGAAVGVGGWIVTVAAVLLLVRQRAPRGTKEHHSVAPPRPATHTRDTHQHSRRRRRHEAPAPVHGAAGSARPTIEAVWAWTLAAGLLLAATLYLGFPAESIYGGRDEGVYANHGVYLAHHARLDVPYPWPADVHSLFIQNSVKFPGFYRTERTMTVQFGHLFPLWLAQAFSTLGYHGLFRLNALFAWLALAIFYGICRLALPRPYAIVATLFLAFNPSQVWMARITLSEIPAQLFTLSGLLLLMHAVRDGDRPLARWAGVCFGVAAFVRFDSFLLVPLLLLSHAAMRFVAADHTARAPDQDTTTSPWPALYQAAVPLFILALAYFAIFSGPYLAERYYSRKLVVAGAAALAILLASRPAVPRRLRALLTAPPTLAVAALGWLAVAAYWYWIRPAPSPAPKLVWRWPGYSFDSTRDYSRDSLVNLGRYLSPAVVWSAIGGWFAVLADLVRRGRHRHLLPGLIMILGVSVVHLANPIPEDHMWTIRRFIPLAIPGFVLCATLGMHWLFTTLPVGTRTAGARTAMAVASLLFLVWFTVRADRLIVTFAEDKGYFSQIEQLARQLPADEVILARGWTEWVTPLYVAFDRRVVPLNLDPAGKGWTVLQTWVARQAAQGKPAYLLLEGSADLSGFQLRQLGEAVITRVFSEPTMNPLPRTSVTTERRIRLFEIRGRGLG